MEYSCCCWGCRVHAASVLHMCNNLARCPDGLRDCDIIEDIVECSIYMAAIGHDFQHPGLTNDFLVMSYHEFAIAHNDKSPLENHHASAMLKTMYKHFTADDHKVCHG